MRTQVDFCRLPRIGRKAIIVLGAGLLSQLALAAAPGTVDLLATPPEITASVAPNVALTFDDSGSMAWQYMPDRPSYQTGSSWGISSTPSTNTSYPWFCAGRIDARVTDPDNVRSYGMNGMFYDPNVTYRPPLQADGITEFPQATFTAARNNGILHFRPNNPVTQGTTNLSTASFCSSSVTEDAAYFRLDGDDFLQDWTNRNMIVTSNVWTNVPFMTGYEGARSIGLSVAPSSLLDNGGTNVRVVPDFSNGLTSAGGIYEMEEGAQINDDPTIALVADATYDSPNIVLRVNTKRCTNVIVSWRLRDLNPGNTTTVQPFAVQARVGTSGNFTNLYSVDNANNGGDTPGTVTLATSFNDQQRVQIRWMTTNAGPTNSTPDNMIGIDDIKVSGTCTPPPDGAAYYQLKNTVTLTQDEFGRITTPSSVIYDAANWERVAVPASQRQNFANWFSYYRNRTTAAVSAMSRAFAPFDGNIRVVWQNLGNNAATAGVEAPVLTDQPIYKFADEAVNNNVRTRFYNWLFQIPASGGTPNIAASIKVGEYFKRAGGAVDNNPYWDRDLDRELSCRQNFQINMSDGFWNAGNPHVGGTVANRRYVGTSATLPDGRAYNPGDAQTKFYNRFTGTAISPTMTDVMFHYWASDLRPDFTAAAATRLKVPPFIPDRSTNLFGIPITSGQDPRNNLEVYWNPANDPASWSHLVNFNISFGLDGTLPNTPEVLRELRLGTSSTFIWPYPVVGTDDGRKLDDFWHAALASRGRFLSAQNPEQLITVLQEVIASIIARRGASTAVSVSLPIITDGTTGYTAGYDTTDWSGFVTRNVLDPSTGARIGTLWDAGCILTGGACPSTGALNMPVRDPNSRAILTSAGTPSSGRPFRWSNLTARQQARLNVEPTTIRLDLGTWTADTWGERRLEYVRGSRVNETTPVPRFRTRSSVLGSVIRGQPVYVSSPTSGFPDTFPTGSPERTAADSGFTYSRFQADNVARPPTVYVAANDGMLHAFDGSSGRERYAYVPNAVIENFRLTRSTQFEGGFTPSVDDKPLVTDVFLNGRWRTVLLGSLRLGGRGVYLLDISEPPTSTSVTESSLTAIPLWEYTDVAPSGDSTADCAPGGRHCSSLGYTYESINIARLKYQHKWVALVSSGYFPIDGTDPASNSPRANRTSLLVIDLATGTLLREILTSSASQTADRSFGLSQAVGLDVGSDFIDDVAIAGDLAGNLWRFDLSAEDPGAWKVDLMFTTYGPGGGATAGAAGNVGDRPIASAPVIMADSTRREPIVIFGSGKFIGLPDRSAAIPQQSFYGVEDMGTCDPTDNPVACAAYPIRPNRLTVQKLTQDGNGVRAINPSTEVAPANPLGWRIRLDIPSEPGERSFNSGFPFFSSNMVLLRSIIPKGVDPCDPGARYGLMVVNAATGAARIDPTGANTSNQVGAVLASATPPGNPVTTRGGGTMIIAGLTDGGGPGNPDPTDPATIAALASVQLALAGATDIWHRGAWRDLLQE